MPIQFPSQVSSTPVNTPEQIVEQTNQSISRLYDISAKPEFSQRLADLLMSLSA